MKLQTQVFAATLCLVSAAFALQGAQTSWAADPAIAAARATSRALKGLGMLLPSGSYVGRTHAGAECRIEVTADAHDYELRMNSLDSYGRSGTMIFHLSSRLYELGLFSLGALIKSEPEHGAMTVSAHDLVDAIMSDEVELSQETAPRTLTLEPDSEGRLQAIVTSGTNPYPQLSCYSLTARAEQPSK